VISAHAQGKSWLSVRSGANAASAPVGRRNDANRTGALFLALGLVLAGIGAAIAPLLADLVSLAAGILTVHLAISALTAGSQKPGQPVTTKLLKAV
jgi:hypothetical protein